jgi:hypothetical protein
MRISISSVAILCAFQALAYSQQSSVTLHGVIWNPEGRPLSGVQIAVHGGEGAATQTVTSGDDGTFAVENLKPGKYQVTETKSGFIDSAATTVELAPGQPHYIDLTLTPGLNPPQGTFWHRVTQNTERTLKRIF